MSKAFVKDNDENEDAQDEAEEPKLPPGGKNLITPGGAKRMQDELRNLRYKVRPEVTKLVAWAASLGDRSENADYTYNKKRLRDIDRRMRFLSKRLESAEVIDPGVIDSDQILFGATVTIRDEDDNQKTYSIVGVDEVDVAKRRISWASPLGGALLKARRGDVITFNSPKGAQEIEIIDFEYVAIE